MPGNNDKAKADFSSETVGKKYQTLKASSCTLKTVLQNEGKVKTSSEKQEADGVSQQQFGALRNGRREKKFFRLEGQHAAQELASSGKNKKAPETANRWGTTKPDL